MMMRNRVSAPKKTSHADRDRSSAPIAAAPTVSAQGFLTVGLGASAGGLEALDPMQKIIALLRDRIRHDFSAYKPAAVRRRIEGRMNLHQIKSPNEYLRVLQDNPHEIDLLFKELLIGVTNFIRDGNSFEALGKTALKSLLNARPEDAVVRVWVPGCATGEEAFSLAILLRECADRMKKRFNFQVFATDLDNRAIETARAGVYPEGIAVDVSQERLARFFTKADGGYRIKAEIREMVIFATRNVCQDPPFTKLDLVSCRNLLIYLNAPLQKRLLSLFHYALKPDGLLFLGPSESIGELRDHFVVVDKKAKIYRRTGLPPAVRAPMAFSAKAVETTHSHTAPSEAIPAMREPRLATLFERLLLGRFAPASVIVNDRGDISYIHGQTCLYLEPTTGQPRYNVMEMAREGLRLALTSALRRAVRQKSEVIFKSVRVKTNGNFIMADVAVKYITEPETLRGLFLVTFQPARLAALPAAKRKKPGADGLPPGRAEELERELAFTRESLQSTVEELQATTEELKSSTEEMQSTNEELQTANAQLQNKVEETTQANDDMQNLLNSTSIPAVFLDGQMRIRRFTDEARKVFHLSATDVGRPLAAPTSSLNYDRLVADAAEVLRTLAPREAEVATREGDWWLARILPYRTTENVIDGLVITLADITRAKRAEQAAAHSCAYAESIAATVREPLLVLDQELRVVSANRAFYRHFKASPAETERRLVYELGNGQWNVPRLRLLLQHILPGHSFLEDFEVAHNFPGLGRRIMLVNARRLEQTPSELGFILLAMEDVTQPRAWADGAENQNTNGSLICRAGTSGQADDSTKWQVV